MYIFNSWRSQLNQIFSSAGVLSSGQGQYRGEFEDILQWKEFVRLNPIVVNKDYIEEAAEQMRTHGFFSDFHEEKAAARDIQVAGSNYRETFLYKGLNCRLRAVVTEMERAGKRLNQRSAKIYSPEGLSDFALLLRGRYPKFIGSEFTMDPAQIADLFPIEAQDLAKLTFPDSAFDMVAVNDVFEHVPDLNAVLREICRVTADGGCLISTFPFALQRETDVIKATMKDGEIEYLCSPEYHGDPMNKKGALVFKIPSWSILDDCKRAGFKDAKMVFLSAPDKGIISTGVAGIFLLKASK